jgi:tRNA(fMet)-specific endonuclease VapC
MNGRYLLDTNIVIAFLTADPTVQSPEPDSELYLSSTAIGELFYGALNSIRIEDNIQRLLTFLQDATSLSCDQETAKLYGEVKMMLRKKGRPIPDNDIWIASSAIQHSLTLVTRDEHFSNIESLHTVRW